MGVRGLGKGLVCALLLGSVKAIGFVLLSSVMLPGLSAAVLVSILMWELVSLVFPLDSLSVSISAIEL